MVWFWDIVVPKCRPLIEVRGCFWHRHGWEWNGRKLVQTDVRVGSSSCIGAAHPSRIAALLVMGPHAKNLDQKCTLISPTNFTIPLPPCHSVQRVVATISAATPSPTLRHYPKFTMREVGSIVQMTPTLADDCRLVDIVLNVQFVSDPIWKDYGVKAPPATPSRYDLPMEQPFFPVRSVDVKTTVKPGRTMVFVGGGLSQKESGNKTLLVFVTVNGVTADIQ